MSYAPLVERGRLVHERTDEQRFIFFDARTGQKGKLQRKERCAYQQDLIAEAGNQANIANTQPSMSSAYRRLRN